MAIADYAKFVEADPKNTDALSRLGLLRFARGDFGKASADFSRVLELRADVYTILFRYLARAHLGEAEAAKAELAANAERTKFRLWPYAFIELYLGKRSAQDLLNTAIKRSDRCLAQFYVGEWFTLNGSSVEAVELLNSATETCLKDSIEYGAAVGELARLKS